MNKWYVLLLTAVVLMLFVLSCERTATESDIGRVVDLKEIPLDFGELEAVTTDAAYKGWAQLWFADSSGVIRMVRINWMDKKMLEEIIIIDRN